MLAAVAGFVDTVGFVGLAGLFLAHVTGDMVLVGADLASGDPMDSVPRLAVVAIFVGGIAAVARFAPRTGPSAMRRLLWIETGLLFIFAAAGMALIDGRDAAPTAPLRLFVALPGVLAMSVHASIRRIGGGPMTQVMTGNVTQATFDVIDALAPRSTPDDDSRLRAVARRGAILVLSFLAGVVLAGVLLPRVGFACAALPGATVAWLAIRCRAALPRA